MTTKSDRSNQHVFFIAQISDPGTERRFNSDLVFNTIANPAAKQAGFAGAKRADDIDLPGRITDRVIDRIVNGPAVIADLSGRNPNVYYEVALAHAARRPFVQLIEASERGQIPFDVVDQSTIDYEANNFPSYTAAAGRVFAQLKSAVENPEAIDNPVTAGLRFPGITASPPDPTSDMAKILPYLERLDRRLNALEQSVTQSASTPLANFLEAQNRWGHSQSVAGIAALGRNRANSPLPRSTVIGSGIRSQWVRAREELGPELSIALGIPAIFSDQIPADEDLLLILNRDHITASVINGLGEAGIDLSP